MGKKTMSLEEAADILYGSKKNSSYWDALRMINKAVKENPEAEIQYKGKGIPLMNVISAIGEAGQIGLERNSRMEKDRIARRKIVAERIKQIRQIKKITQEDISEAIDWNTLTYRGYENCKSDVPIVILLRLADYYDVSMDYLTGRTASPYEAAKSGGKLEQRLAKLEETIQKMQEKDQ